MGSNELFFIIISIMKTQRANSRDLHWENKPRKLKDYFLLKSPAMHNSFLIHLLSNIHVQVSLSGTQAAVYTLFRAI